MGETSAKIPNPLELLARDHLEFDGMRFLKRSDSLMIAGTENSFHGDKGVNGARGSISAYKDIGVKCNTGHGHSPAIEGGHYRAGTNSRLDLEYAKALVLAAYRRCDLCQRQTNAATQVWPVLAG